MRENLTHGSMGGGRRPAPLGGLRRRGARRSETGARAAPADCPSFARSLLEDLDALVVHLRFPAEHRKRIRGTNLLERTFVEVRRRAKVIRRIPGEISALALVFNVVELASRGWRGVVMTPKAAAEIERLRRAIAAGEPLEQPTGGEREVAA